MSATVLPFPLSLRRAFIEKQARYASELSPDAAERHIQQQLRMQADVMRRKGVNQALIARELRCMEIAIRNTICRSHRAPEGRA